MSESTVSHINKSFISSSVLTSLKIRNYLLFGIGTFLKLYDLDDQKREVTLNIFTTAVIHGIRECQEKRSNRFTLLIYGQKYITIISIDEFVLSCETVLPEYKLEDWIVDAKWGCDETILILTAHNKILQLNLKTTNKNRGMKTEISKNGISQNFIAKECCENSLLYSGYICGNSLKCSVLMGGTAFGSIIIWTSWSTSLENGKITPLHILSEPKGAIFSLIYDEDLKLLASTSDDRSVRLWIITTESSCTDPFKFWEKSDIKQIFCSYGHTARVWRCIILKDQTLLSCGEDSKVCHWSSNGSLLLSWQAHSGSSIWCIASANQVVYTGGSDGAIKMWHLGIKNKKLKIVLPLLPIKVQGESNADLYLKNMNLKVKDFPRSINLINSSSAIIVSNGGYVWMWKQPLNYWTLLFENFVLKGYVITAMNEHSTLLALGTLSGCVIIFSVDRLQCICETSVSSTKIQSLIFVEDILMTCSSGSIQLWSVKCDDMIDGNLQLLQEHTLPHCRQHWVTAFAFCGGPLAKKSNSFVAGDPCGTLYLYVPQEKRPSSSLMYIHGSQGVSSINDSENFIITSGRDGHIRFLTVINNQLRLVYDMKIPYGNWICGIIQWQHYLIVPMFSGTKLQFWNVSEDQIICDLDCGGGHRSWDILIWNKRFISSGHLKNFCQSKEHSCLTYSFLKAGNPFVYKTTFEDKLFLELQTPLSGREIQCLLPLWTYKKNAIISFAGEDTLLHLQFVKKTKICRITAIKNHLSSIRSMVKIQDFSHLFKEEIIFKNNTKEVFILTCGGRAQMKVWKYSLTLLGEAVLHEKMLYEEKTDTVGDKLKNNDLKLNSDSQLSSILNYSVNETREPGFYSSILNPLVLCKEIGSHMLNKESKSHWKYKDQVYDPETRYMDSLALWIKADIALFLVASSDGFLRVFKYLLNGDFKLLHSEDCNFCLLCLNLMEFKQTNIVVATTTRGNLIFWDLKKFVDLIIEYEDEASEKIFDAVQLRSFQLSSSGINCLNPQRNICKEEERCDSLSLAAGCDSGEIYILKVEILCQASVPTETSVVSIDVKIVCQVVSHAAQVSGIAWLSSDTLCSVSIDQRFIVWKYQEHKSSFLLTPIDVAFTSVPDIQGLRVFPKNLNDVDNTLKVYVFGSGLQLFEVVVK